MYVAPGSAAARAGVLPGDVIEQLDDEAISQSADVIGQLQVWNRTLAVSGDPTTLHLRRESESLTVTLVPDRVCDFRVTLQQDSRATAAFS